MLSLRFSRDDYAFIYTEGRPIGAILVGETRGRSQFSLLFSGPETEFEILRPQTVERRFGRQELEKLQSQFLRPSPKRSDGGRRTVTRFDSLAAGGRTGHKESTGENVVSMP